MEKKSPRTKKLKMMVPTVMGLSGGQMMLPPSDSLQSMCH
jgi:hypothetical protein